MQTRRESRAICTDDQVGRVLDALHIDPPEPDDNKGPMKRQADDLSRDWVSRFRDEDAGVEVRT